MSSTRKQLERIIAIIVLTLIYSVTLVIAFTGKLIFRRKKLNNRIIINGTFHNPNWFYSHIAPIALSNFGETILVCDEPIDDLPNLTYRCPPRWATRILTRAGAKAIWTFYYGLKNSCGVYMGYHIFPSAITALICARLTGGKAIYQVTSGQLELAGGGWGAENRLLVALGKASSLIEYLALRVTDAFDLVVIRGSNAKKFLREHGVKTELEIITGSVEIKSSLVLEKEKRDIDIIYVGRLSETKRIDRLLRIVKQSTSTHPNCQVLIVGDGPDRVQLEQETLQLGLKNNVTFAGQRTDIFQLLGRSKVMLLTSRWEGVSIAMLEAMGMGTVPVVSNVGDLGDFVKNDSTGFILPQDDINAFSQKVNHLLKDQESREKYAASAMDLIATTCERTALAHRWCSVLSNTTST